MDDPKRPNGFNPLRWKCAPDGCYNVKHRPKIEIFADCFPGEINFGDCDAAMVEINHRYLYLEWKSQRGPVPKGQDILFTNLSLTGWFVIAVVVGDAETMAITDYGLYIGGTFCGWKKGDVEKVKDVFRKWAKRVQQLDRPRLKQALPQESMSEHAQWIAEYDAAECSFAL